MWRSLSPRLLEVFLGGILLVAMLAPPRDSPCASPPAQLEPFGLQGRMVTCLDVYGSLYAGTLDDGVFRRDLMDPQSSWVSLGLLGEPIRAIYPHQSGALGRATTAGLEADPLNLDQPLIYCAEMDQPPWIASGAGMLLNENYGVWSLDGFPSPAVCGETFAATTGGNGQVWRRDFSSTQWEMVLDLGFSVGNVVRADQASGHVWAGGETSVLAPWIARSTDLGETWNVVYPELAGDNACNDIAVHPDDPDVAYAGMEGLVLETSDGGASWSETGLTGVEAYIYGISLDSANPAHLLAGGMVRDPNSWALWESENGGQTWTPIPLPAPKQLEPGTGISAIVADPDRPHTFYISTFGAGVWRYVNVVTAADAAPERTPLLQQNHPNPFNPTTTIPFTIPPALDGAPVQLAIYSARGALVRILVEGIMPTGSYRSAWNGEDAAGRPMPSGVYLCELQVGAEQESRKITLLR